MRIYDPDHRGADSKGVMLWVFKQAPATDYGTERSFQLGQSIVRFRQKPTQARAFSVDVGEWLPLCRILPVRNNLTRF